MKIELIFLWILSHLAHQTESVVRLSTNPSNGKVEVGSYWSMSCEIDGATNIVWYKWVGDLRIMIGHNDMVLGRQNDIISAGRFILDAKQNQEALLSELAMSNSQLEDSGRYECTWNTENASAIFVVCDDPGSSYCDCMLKNGWANPMCYPQDFTDETQHYKNVLAGLGITLAVSTVYVVLITIFYGRDCLKLYQQDRMERAEKKKKYIRSRVTRETLKAFKLSDSDQTHLTPSETNSEISAETAGNSEDSGFSGSTKDRRKDRNKTAASAPLEADAKSPDNINFAYSSQYDVTLAPPSYDPLLFAQPSTQAAIESISKSVEFSGTMI